MDEIAYSAPLLGGCQDPGHAAVLGSPMAHNSATAERISFSTDEKFFPYYEDADQLPFCSEPIL